MCGLQSVRAGLPGTWVHQHERGGDGKSHNVLERSGAPAKPASWRGVYAIALGKRMMVFGSDSIGVESKCEGSGSNIPGTKRQTPRTRRNHKAREDRE